jgi:hypothetical protein
MGRVLIGCFEHTSVSLLSARRAVRLPLPKEGRQQRGRVGAGARPDGPR